MVLHDTKGTIVINLTTDSILNLNKKKQHRKNITVFPGFT